MFAFRWDGIGRLGITEKLLCFAQTRRKKWDYIAWNQIAERGGQAIKPKDGEAEADCVDYKHLRRVVAEDGKNGQVNIEHGVG